MSQLPFSYSRLARLKYRPISKFVDSSRYYYFYVLLQYVFILFGILLLVNLWESTFLVFSFFAAMATKRFYCEPTQQKVKRKNENPTWPHVNIWRLKEQPMKTHTCVLLPLLELSLSLLHSVSRQAHFFVLFSIPIPKTTQGERVICDLTL